MIRHSNANKFENKEFRDAYMEGHVRATIPTQLRLIRESQGLTQAGSASLMGKPQSTISRIENTEYGALSLTTLIEAAQAYGVGLIVKFVEFSEFLKAYSDLSPANLTPRKYEVEQQSDQQAAPAESYVAMDGSSNLASCWGTIATAALGRPVQIDPANDDNLPRYEAIPISSLH